MSDDDRTFRQRGMIPGAAEYAKWKRGIPLTRQEAIAANCYICNGREDSPCGGSARCVLHQFSPFKQSSDKQPVIMP